MVAYNTASWAETDLDGRHDARWSGLAPWVVNVASTDSASADAGNAQIELNIIFNKLMDITRTWNRFKDAYHGTDAVTVHHEMDRMVGEMSAITQSGDLFLEATDGYIATMNSGLSDIKDTEDEWARGYVRRYRTFERHRDTLEEEEFKAANSGKTVLEVGGTLADEYQQHVAPAEGVFRTINTARSDYTSAIKAIDLESLSELRFETRDEAVVAVETEEDLAVQIRNSAMFGQLGLSEEQALELARQIMADGTWDDHADFVDNQGRAWVMAPEGYMVRVGSQLDPVLGESVLTAVAEDPGLAPRLDDVTLPGMNQSVGAALTAAGIPLGQGGGTIAETVAKSGFENNFHVAGGMFFVGANVVMGIAGSEVNAQQYRQQQAGTYFMLSTSDLKERTQRERYLGWASEGISTGLSYGVSAVAAAPTGGTSVVVGVVIDEVTGEIVSWIVQEIDESMTTMTVNEVNESTDAELIANSEPEDG